LFAAHALVTGREGLRAGTQRRGVVLTTPLVLIKSGKKGLKELKT
jgi:hypothetical protein